ncbi:hypothetical protein Q5752_004220 [Cryptotrichosporon argae]
MDQASEYDVADDRPDLGHLARWSVSSHKYGFGVDNLRDNDDTTFWQSEGPQPHTIDVSFPKRVSVSMICLLTSHQRDDSYTPSKISVRAGTGVHDLQEVRIQEFDKPDGWIMIPLRPMDADGEGDVVEGPPIPCHHLRVVIIANHLNGKDTHVRGLKIFGPPTQALGADDDDVDMADADAMPSGPQLLRLGHDGLSGFTSQRFKMHERVR